MSQSSDRFWARLDAIAGRFFPPRVRPFLSYRWMTAFVGFVFVWNLLLKFFMPAPPAFPVQIAIEHVMLSPFFLVPFDAVLSTAGWFVITSKPSPEVAYLRGLLYGMVLAALLGECLISFVPWRG